MTAIPIEIRHRDDNRVIYTSTKATDLRSAVVEAVAARANLARAYLDGANLARANLDGANLDGANLVGSNLVGSNLVGSNLARANLDGANIVSVASVAFTAHGERGRNLLAIQTEKGIALRCGCFTGSPDELREYIAKGDESLKPSRTLALDTVLTLLACPKGQP